MYQSHQSLKIKKTEAKPHNLPPPVQRPKNYLTIRKNIFKKKNVKKDLKIPKYSEVFRKPVSSIPVESTIVQNPRNISPISVTHPHIIPKESENIKKQSNVRSKTD